MCVVCHDSARVVWAAPGRSQGGDRPVFEQLGPERCRLIESCSVDLHGGWPGVIARYCPQAAICADPFHVVKLAGEALDELRRADWQRLRETEPERARWLKGTRFLLRRRSETLGDRARSVLEDLAETNQEVYRGWLLTDQLRMVYLAQSREEARDLIDEWIFAGATSDLEPFIRVAITFERHANAIANAVWFGATAPAASVAFSRCCR